LRNEDTEVARWIYVIQIILYFNIKMNLEEIDFKDLISIWQLHTYLKYCKQIIHYLHQNILMLKKTF